MGHCFLCTTEVCVLSGYSIKEFFLMVNILDLPDKFTEKQDKLTCICFCQACLDKIKKIQSALGQLEEIEEQVLRHKFEIESILKNTPWKLTSHGHGEMGPYDIRNEIAEELRSRAMRAMLSKLKRKSIVGVPKENAIGNMRRYSSPNSEVNNTNCNITTDAISNSRSHQDITDEAAAHVPKNSASLIAPSEVMVAVADSGEFLSGFHNFEEIDIKPNMEENAQDPIAIELPKSFFCGSCGQVFQDYDQLVSHDALGCSDQQHGSSLMGDIDNAFPIADSGCRTFASINPGTDNKTQGFRVKVVLEPNEAVKKLSNLQCKHCRRIFSRQSHYQDHLSTHHQRNVNLNLKRKRHKCKVCGNDYASSRGLKMHQRNFHTVYTGNRQSREQEKPFKCNICSKCFATRDQLPSHMQMHKRLEAINLLL